MRHICYVTGTRADFGLMCAALGRIAATPGCRLTLAATGMHLDPACGETIGEVRAAGFEILGEVAVPHGETSGATMARHIGAMLVGFTNLFEQARPDLVLLLGDRGEMLAGALAAIHLNIPVAHVHGGERSGTVDEPVRHAISKLSHIHCAASPGAAERLVRMGEHPAHVHVTGAPGLDGLDAREPASREAVCERYGFDAKRPLALMVFHPVLQEATSAAQEAQALLDNLRKRGVQTVALMPNSDAGSQGVRDVLAVAAGAPGLAVETHLPRDQFLDVMASADVMVGNSSAGIIEAASFGTPVINIGRRQNLRERNANVLDIASAGSELLDALDQALANGRFPRANVYGDGQAGQRIAALLTEYALTPELLMKVNAF